MAKWGVGGAGSWAWLCGAGALLAACSGDSGTARGNDHADGATGGGSGLVDGGHGEATPEGGTLPSDAGHGIQTSNSDGGARVPPTNPPGVTSSTKVDLLLVVDNSSSMADKQLVLKNTIPDLVKQLTDPSSGVTDLHVGVITSSLGGHGAMQCVGSDTSGKVSDEEQNDHGWLVATRPRYQTERAKPEYATAEAPVAQGFLEWTPSVGTAAFELGIQSMVTAAGEQGCGYESQLEAMYRFLVDPAPYESIVLNDCSPSYPGVKCATPQGTDSKLLAQRAAFLRPDSAVVIVELSDENDCSIRESSQYYFAAMSPSTVTLPPGSQACAANPNDPCCYSCGSSVPAGCVADPTCSARSSDPAWKTQDFANLRCFDERKRYGIDFLYPVARYANALQDAYICPSSATPAGDPSQCAQPTRNPLFFGSNGVVRDRSLVYFVDLVGVPWQDVKASANGAGTPFPSSELHYQSPVTASTWSTILGDATPPNAAPPIEPTDVLMQESSTPRTGTDANGDPIVPPDNAPAPGTPGANPINGHEWYANLDGNADLQYACVFPLDTPHDCSTPDVLGIFCECTNMNPATADPLCQSAAGTYASTQYYAGAHPGLRELSVAKAVGDTGVVGSICPRNTKDATAQDFGYRPAIDALVLQLNRSVH